MGGVVRFLVNEYDNSDGKTKTRRLLFNITVPITNFFSALSIEYTNKLENTIVRVQWMYSLSFFTA